MFDTSLYLRIVHLAKNLDGFSIINKMKFNKDTQNIISL